MGYEELLETLRARNIVRAEWTVYYYNDEDTSEGGTLSFADGSDPLRLRHGGGYLRGARLRCKLRR